jgi:hypothetical protein
VLLFSSYSHRDERYRQRLVKHLAPLKREGVLTDWNDREISAGVEWAVEIAKQLDKLSQREKEVDGSAIIENLRLLDVKGPRLEVR